MIFVFLRDLFTGWWDCLLQCKGQCKCAFFPLLPLICSPSILAPTNTRVTLRHGPVISFCYCTLCRPYHLRFPFPFSFSYSPYSYLFFWHPGFLSLLQPLAYNPTLFFLFSGLFFQNSILSTIPPPTLSQVERFLPCFSSNWRMRCMSWLHCCFIRKQLFALLPSPLLLFSSLFTSLPHSLSTLYYFLHISSRLSSYISLSVRLSLMQIGECTEGVINLQNGAQTMVVSCYCF